MSITETDPSLALQAAQKTALEADATLAALGLGGRVRDRVEDDTPFPFIKIGEDLVMPLDDECGSETIIFSTVRVYTRSPGRVMAKRFAERIRFLLTKQAGFAVDDYRMTIGYCEEYAVREHTDGITCHAELNFRYRLEPKGRLAIARQVIAGPVLSAIGKLKIRAQAAATIPGVILSAASRLAIAGAVAATLGPVTLSASATVFSPDMLFASGETGAVYDPSDLTSLYQLRTGGSIVSAAGQTVGVMLDKSRMGGQTAAEFISAQPELITNGDFSSGLTTGWTASPGTTFDVVAGAARVENSGAAAGGAYQTFATVSGVTYRLFLNLSNFFTAGTARISVNNGSSPSFNGSQYALSSAAAAQEIIFTAAGSSSTLALYVNSTLAGARFDFDNVSIKEIPGFHAIAPSDAARPLYGRVPVTGRRNLATYSQDFQNRIWTKNSVSVTPNAAVAPDGTTTAALLTPAAASEFFYNTITAQPAGQYRFSIWIKSATGSPVSSSLFSNSSGVTPNPSIATPFTATTEWQRIVHPLTSSGAGTIQFGIGGIGSGSNTFAVGENLHVWGAQIEPGTSPTDYQRVDSALDVSEAGVASAYFLQPDGVDDRLQVFPTCNLGETWSNVSGWKAAGNALYPFATSSQYFGSLRSVSNKWIWYDSSIAVAILSNSDTTNAHVATIEQASTVSLSLRFNGVADLPAIVPADDTAATQGLALFTNSNNSFGAGWNGRFYGGAWINRAVTTAERRALERYYAAKTGVAI